MTTTTSPPLPAVEGKSSSTDIQSRPPPSIISVNSEHHIDERYPKTCFELIPPIILEYPPSKQNNQPPSRSRHSLRFRTQPVTLTEIYEADEENHIESDPQQKSHSKLFNDYDRLEHLTLVENLRRATRKKVPLKNFLERQRLKTTREELCETDGN